MARQKHIIVVGAGIVGALLPGIWQRRARAPTIVASGAPGGLATPNSFAWIQCQLGKPNSTSTCASARWPNGPASRPRCPPFRCSGRGRFASTLPSSIWGDIVPGRCSRGYGIRRVGRAEAARLEPRDLPNHRGLRFTSPVRALTQRRNNFGLDRRCRARGAGLHASTEVRGLVQEGGRVRGVQTDTGTLEADEVVIAAGTGSAELLAGVGVALGSRRRPACWFIHGRTHRCFSRVWSSAISRMSGRPPRGALSPAPTSAEPNPAMTLPLRHGIAVRCGQENACWRRRTGTRFLHDRLQTDAVGRLSHYRPAGGSPGSMSRSCIRASPWRLRSASLPPRKSSQAPATSFWLPTGPIASPDKTRIAEPA